jgi:CCR4-NOT transcriptional regulation complex NOT5 subunit
MEREIQWEADLKKTPASDKALTQEVVLTLEQQKTRSALDFLSTTIEKLRRQVETDSATVERVLAKNARLRADEQEEDQEEADRAERIGELNDEREWHIERLEKIERMLLNEEADAGQALALKDMLNHFLDSNEVRSPSRP